MRREGWKESRQAQNGENDPIEKIINYFRRDIPRNVGLHLLLLRSSRCHKFLVPSLVAQNR